MAMTRRLTMNASEKARMERYHESVHREGEQRRLIEKSDRMGYMWIMLPLGMLVVAIQDIFTFRYCRVQPHDDDSLQLCVRSSKDRANIVE
jgi:hypothetical protein